MALLLHASPLLFTAPLCGRGGARSMRPQVESLEDGGVRLSLPLPGLGEGDVTVEVADAENGGGVLLIHAQPHGETELSLPKDVDKAAVTASLKDGVLRVTLPKLAPLADVSVPVSSTPLPEELPEPRATATLALPGTAAEGVSVTISQTHAGVKSVRISARGVQEVMRLPFRARAAEAQASCVNGVFNFSVPLAPEAVADVPVAESKYPEDCSDLRLLEAAVPGLAAADISAQMRGRSLSVTSTKAPLGARPLSYSLRLPASVEDASHIHAFCLHGQLTVAAATTQPQRRTVTLNAAASRPNTPDGDAQMAEAQAPAAAAEQ